jgi:hypothetical protein
MTADVLDMQVLDVTASPWEDLRREVLADDPEAVAPVFVGDSELAGIFLCDTCGACSYTDLACECSYTDCG